MKKKFESRVNIPALQCAVKNGQLYFDQMPSDGQCDHCGKQGWSYLIGVGKPEEMEGHLQNADFCVGIGSGCFKNIKKLVGGEWKRFDWEKFGDSGSYFKEV